MEKKKKKKGGVAETTGIRLECYSKKMEKKNTEILERDLNVLSIQWRRLSELMAA